MTCKSSELLIVSLHPDVNAICSPEGEKIPPDAAIASENSQDMIGNGICNYTFLSQFHHFYRTFRTCLIIADSNTSIISSLIIRPFQIFFKSGQVSSILNYLKSQREGFRFGSRYLSQIKRFISPIPITTPTI